MKYSNAKINTTILPLILCFIFLNGVCSAEKLTHHVNFDWSQFSIDTINSSPDSKFISIYNPDAPMKTGVGKPELPTKYVILQIPQHAINFRVNILRTEITQTLRVPYKIAPTQPLHSLNELSEAVFVKPDGISYSIDSIFNEAMILDDFYLNGDTHVIRLGVTGAGYCAYKDLVELYSDVHIELEYDYGVNNHIPLSVNKNSIHDYNLKNYVDNIPSTEYLSESNIFRESSEIEHKYYYIITPRYLETSLKDISTLKKQKGYNVVIKAVEDILNMPDFSIGSNANNVDAAACVRSWLISERERVGNFFLLMVGDEDSGAPIRK